MLERWTAAVLRARAAVLAAWLVVLAAGVFAATGLSEVLTTSFAVPGTESERARTLLREHFGERPDGTFVVVFRVERPSDATVRMRLQRRLDRVARLLPGGRARDVEHGGGIVYGELVTRLDLNDAKRHTPRLREALREQGAAAPALVTGQPAIQYDLDPVLASDLRRGETIAVVFALFVLLALLGFSLAVALPFAFAACTIAATLLGVAVVARLLPTSSYVTNLVALIGLGLAVDYSLLIVHRFREELRRGDDVRDAVVRTMSTAGRAVAYSGLAVAVGLSLLLFVPVPFVRSMGVAGLLVPLVSVAGALTLQPVLLALIGRRIARRADRPSGRWAALARAIMRRPWRVLALATAVLLALAAPAASLELSPGSFAGIPRSPESTKGLQLLQRGVGSGAITPTHVVVEGSASTRPAVERLVDELVRDPEVHVVGSGRRPPFASEDRRYARVIVAGRHDYGADETRRFVRRLREHHVPRARFFADAEVVAGGAPAQGVDFLDETYGAFPWLAAGVLLVTFVVLLLAFRSLLLPVKAVLLNVLTVAAVYGVLVVVFQRGFASELLRLEPTDEIEGWVPVFLFATLFGLSMDYEMFLVMRMREAWDEHHDNVRAVAHGLERTGRLITAAALIMVAAFAGLVAGRVSGLEQLGLGLAFGVLIDATIVRALLVPSLMAILGRWNWWLPWDRGREARAAPPGPL